MLVSRTLGRQVRAAPPLTCSTASGLLVPSTWARQLQAASPLTCPTASGKLSSSTWGLQVRAAFLAGLVVVLLLTVATRWLGLRTEAAATTQMGFKDARVKAVGELLRGMHHIKAAAWEPVFLGQARALAGLGFVSCGGLSCCQLLLSVLLPGML